MTKPIAQPSTGGRRLLAAITVFALHCLTLLIALYVSLYVVSSCAKFFEELDVRLPVHTELLITLSYSVAEYWYLLIPAAVVFDIVVIAVLSRASVRRRWLLSLYSHLWMSAVIVFLFWVTVSLSAALPV